MTTATLFQTIITIAACGLLCTAAAAASAATAEQPVPSLLDRHAATLGFSRGTPQQITVTPAGEAVLFLRSAGPESSVLSLYSFDVATGKESLLLSAEKLLGGVAEVLTPEELARRERMRSSARGIATYSLSQDGKRLLVPLSGELYVVNRDTGKVLEIPTDHRFPIDTTLSPDGSTIGCVREGDLYTINLRTMMQKRITQRPDGKAGEFITNGVAEFAAQEEMSRSRGYWWSPDAELIAYQQNDDSELETYYIADPSKPAAAPQSWKYPRAGQANTKVKLAIVRTGAGSDDPNAGGKTVWVDWDGVKYPYLATVKWPKVESAAGVNGPLTILVQNREQTEQVLYRVDAATGKCTELLRETDAAWINLDQSMPRWLDSGKGFLWIAERDGFEQLELRNADGSLNRVVADRSIGFQEFVAADEARGVVYVKAHTDPTQSHVWRVKLHADAEMKNQAMTNFPQNGPWGNAMGTHAVVFAKDFSVAVVTSNTIDARPDWRVYSRADKGAPTEWRDVGRLKSLAERPDGAPDVELSTVTVERRTYHVAITRPRGMKPGVKYPVLVNVYGGPTALTATAVRRGPWLDQWLADQGFIIISADNRGTPGRGGEWEKCVKGNLIDKQLQDQRDVLKAVCAKHPEMDGNRAGMFGWSFGGYFSAMAALREPDVFKACIAGAPVCDWADYDTHYTERYMGLPSRNAEGYRLSNVETFAGTAPPALAPDRSAPLLIIHGTADDNVYFVHGLKIAGAMMKAGRRFEFVPLPGHTHSVRDADTIRSIWRTSVSFFKRHLGEPAAVK